MRDLCFLKDEAGPGRKKMDIGINRRARSIGLSFVVIAVIPFLLIGADLLHGQNRDDALFIDGAGRVGIGTNDPKATLDVAGNLSVSDNTTLSNAAIKESLTAATLNVTDNANLSNLTLKGSLITGGNIGIGRPDASNALHMGAGKVLRIEGGTSNTDTANYFSFGGHGTFGIDAPGVPNGRFVVQNSGNVGIGTTDPKAALDVKGDAVVSGSINGEDPPMKFTVGEPREQKKWLAVEKDIGGLCGDEDGCRIKLLLQHEITDQVRTITEEIFIEQPSISNNREPGLRGYTRQSGGGDYEWILDWPGHLYDICNPWQWFWVKNYRHENAYGTRGPAYTGQDRYKVTFMSHPIVTATVIIYDR